MDGVETGENEKQCVEAGKNHMHNQEDLALEDDPSKPVWFLTLWADFLLMLLLQVLLYQRDSPYISLIQEAGLDDMSYTGKSFTWSSNVHGTGVQRSRLDRALTNAEKRNWKYLQCYERNESLKSEVEAAWNHQINGSHAFRVSKRLVITRKYVSKWNKENFGNIQRIIFLLHQQIEAIQQDSKDNDATSQVQQPKNQIEHWNQIQNEFWGKKARDEYYLEMDRNTKHHYANANKTRSKNNITALKDENGDWCTTRMELERLLTRY
ncbi:uncharacterized protein LOC113280063 [Papaver somniferum]|uniref:uncharacterized protein LOC113280063 n=1 Tax=Papaver somniferum TaxID=3469 RepID=UPI000E6F7256|nr:uncharacterized protein LOC113280063 [Papaver somniferum]